MAQAEKNRIMGPLDATCPAVQIQGIPLPIIADLPEGGFLQFINGENPLGIPVPGPQLAKGCMVVVIEPAIAAQMRPALKAAEAAQMKALGQPYVRDGKVVPLNAFNQKDD
jgi:hypothetical protein